MTSYIRFFPIRVFLGAMIALWPVAAMAQLAPSSDAPIDITGDKFEAFTEQDKAIWTGDVHVTQGEAVLTAPELTIFGVADGTIDRIDAVGGVRYTNGAEAISGDRAVYNAADETIIFTGSVVAVQGRQVMSGQEMTYYTQNGEVRFSSFGSGRVRGIFYSSPSAAN